MGHLMGRNFSVVGKSVPKIEANDLATGRAKYTIDMELPGMLYTKVLGSPHAHARRKRVDVSKAENLPGVEKVFTFKDAPKIPYNPLCLVSELPRAEGQMRLE